MAVRKVKEPKQDLAPQPVKEKKPRSPAQQAQFQKALEVKRTNAERGFFSFTGCGAKSCFGSLTFLTAICIVELEFGIDLIDIERDLLASSLEVIEFGCDCIDLLLHLSKFRFEKNLFVLESLDLFRKFLDLGHIVLNYVLLQTFQLFY